MWRLVVELGKRRQGASHCVLFLGRLPSVGTIIVDSTPKIMSANLGYCRLGARVGQSVGGSIWSMLAKRSVGVLLAATAWSMLVLFRDCSYVGAGSTAKQVRVVPLSTLRVPNIMAEV